MTRLTYSDAAERDLLEIGLWIATDNPRSAHKFVSGIRQHCLLLTTSQFMGRQRSDIDPDVRSFPHQPYTVYYRRRPERDEVEILRIWHGSRRMPTIADLMQT